MLTLKTLLKRRRFPVALVLVLLMLVASMAATAQATVTCLSGCDGRTGESFWLSCGSSAGNYFALCPVNGGPCTISDARAQPEADMLCAQQASGGGGGGPALEAPPQN